MKRLPYLAGAIALGLPDPSKRLCFHRSVALTMDCPSLKLVVGKMEGIAERDWIPGASLVPWYHAWCESGARLLSPASIEQHDNVLQAFCPRMWHSFNPSIETRVLARRTVLKLARIHNWHGYFLKHKPIETALPIAILEELGFSYFVGPSGEILAR